MSATDSIERLPPQDLNAEKAVLGACLIESDVLARVARLLSHEDFYEPTNGQLFAAFLRLQDKGAPVDFVTVVNAYNAAGKPAPTDILTDLIESCPTSAHAEFYAEIIRDKAARRRVISIASEVTRNAYSEAMIVDTAQRGAKRLVDVTTSSGSGIHHIGQCLDNLWDRMERGKQEKEDSDFIRFPIQELDDAVGPIEITKLVTIAARPGCGKTALAIRLARHFAAEYGPVLVSSNETSEEVYTKRQLASEANLQHGLITAIEHRGLQNVPADTSRIMAAINRLRDIPLYFVYRRMTMAETVAAVMHVQTMEGRRVVAVIQDRFDRMREIAEAPLGMLTHAATQVTINAKAMATDHRLVYIAITQFNQDIDKRLDKRPILADLAHTQAIGQDSQVVIGLTKPDDGSKGYINFWVMKNNDGDADNQDPIQLRFDGSIPQFSGWKEDAA